MGDTRVGAALGGMVGGAGQALSAEMPLLSFGAKGPAVEQLQKQLNQAGYKLNVDGDFGSRTQAAVMDFQKKHGLAVDGIAGPKTFGALAGQGVGAAGAPVMEKAPGGDLRQQLSSIDSPLSRAIGYAEGNRTASGAKTEHYREHQDPVNHQRNAGNFSLQHPRANAAEADQIQLARLREAIPAYHKACQTAGVDEKNPLLAATFFDLYNQSEKAATARGGFLDQLPKLKEAGITPETLTKARIESWKDPGSGQLDHAFKSDQALVADQRRRMGCLAEVAGDGHPQASTSTSTNGYTQPTAGKIGYGSTGPEVRQLKQALKEAGFYQGPINDKMGQQGVEALKLAKTTLGIGGPADLAGPETIQRIQENAGGGQAQVPFISQFDPQVPGDYPGQSANLKCDNACAYMMAQVGTRAGEGNGMVTEFHGGGQSDRSVQYLEQQLKAGHPVMIGVNHPNGSNTKANVNGINHYLVATGIATDQQGRRYIQFHDPAQTDPKLGRDTNPENRLYLDNGQFRQVHAGAHANDPYELRGVVRNFG